MYIGDEAFQTRVQITCNKHESIKTIMAEPKLHFLPQIISSIVNMENLFPPFDQEIVLHSPNVMKRSQGMAARPPKIPLRIKPTSVRVQALL